MDGILTCVLNEKAGSNIAGEARALIARIAAEQGREARILVAGAGNDLASLADEARAAGGLVVAGGGDGTIAAVATALVDTDVTLGVLPMGTLNHFAKDLGIPLELETAIRTLFTGKVTRVDVGEVNGRIFLNNSSIGFYPLIVRERERLQRRGNSKWFAFAQAAAQMFQRSSTLHVGLDDDGQRRQSCDTAFVFVGNNRYELAGLEIGTRAALDGARLWVCAAPYAGRFKLFALAVQALLGLVRDVDLAAFDTGHLDVRMRRRNVLVATDGEVTGMQIPLRYRIRPAALRVVVPAAE